MNNQRIHHLWKGRLFPEREIDAHLDGLPSELSRFCGSRLPSHLLLDVCAKLAAEMIADTETRRAFISALEETGSLTENEIRDGIAGIAEFLKPENLDLKIRRELSSGGLEARDPLDPRRLHPRDTVFEAWAPLGFLVHVAPANAFSVGVLSVIEGLLVSNVNFLKLSRGDGDFPLLFLKRLVDLDSTGRLKDFIYAARIGADESDRLKRVFAEADGVAAWGGEDGIEGVRKLAPKHARFVDWGPKISFAYISRDALKNSVGVEASLRAIARECCVIEQQACSSPQVVYFEVDSPEELDGWAEKLFSLMREESAKVPRILPGETEQAEITSTVELARLESCLGLTRVFSSDDVRVILERKSGLRASPLYRTVWVKPLSRERIVETLRPLRAYLQTAGLLCDRGEYVEIAEALTQAGVLRVTPPGKMLESYLGEPHDGVYALARYAKRVSLQLGEQAATYSRLGELRKEAVGEGPAKLDGPIMTKEGFQTLAIAEKDADLFFKSGGSSGKAKISVFSYEDYHTQMEYAAEGLRAGGLDPSKDRCMNLFFGGGLYGGFLSFFTILEKLRAVQFPMSAYPDLSFVREIIVENRVNVLLGMPSSIIQLFHEEGDALKKYGGVKKIFYGGEHFHELQRKYFRDVFGIEVIRSASYGSVDAGPIGFQCEHSEGSVHHVHSGLHAFEIVDFEHDSPVKRGDAGRLLVTERHRRGQAIRRYEIGDTVREILGDCECGRAQPRIELLGRHGDVFRIGATFLNYRRFERVLQERLNYPHEFQIRLPATRGSEIERIELLYLDSAAIDAEVLRRELLESDSDLSDAILKDGVLALDLQPTPIEKFSRTPGSGKLRRIVDERGTQK